jgi:hypothetical protein
MRDPERRGRPRNPSDERPESPRWRQLEIAPGGAPPTARPAKPLARGNRRSLSAPEASGTWRFGPSSTTAPRRRANAGRGRDVPAAPRSPRHARPRDDGVCGLELCALARRPRRGRRNHSCVAALGLGASNPSRVCGASLVLLPSSSAAQSRVSRATGRYEPLSEWKRDSGTIAVEKPKLAGWRLLTLTFDEWCYECEPGVL